MRSSCNKSGTVTGLRGANHHTFAAVLLVLAKPCNYFVFQKAKYRSLAFVGILPDP
jgi:hypothetical protein